MKSNLTNAVLFTVCFFFACSLGTAQNGLQNIFVEKYYISNANDAAGSIGTLPVGSVTYRIYVDMLPGYTFQVAYGDALHPLSMITTTSFFNNEDRGATSPTYTKANAKYNTVMLDSWLSAGAACVGNFGVPKSEDNGVATVINADAILQNADPAAGIPLTSQDGLLSGTPSTFGTIGIDSAINAVFDATSQAGNSFVTTNGGWYCLAGASGPDTTNKVLIAQITTDGVFSFQLNIQIGTPTSGVSEKYVASNPGVDEFYLSSLTYNSSATGINPNNMQSSNNEANILIYPNPTNGNFNLHINGICKNSTENHYTIYNMMGEVMINNKIEKNIGELNESIDMSGLPKGIYFVEVGVNSNRSTQKLVIR